MRMQVVLVMDMSMIVLDRDMRVLVAMPLRKVQPKADRNQEACRDELQRDRLAK
jgi:hypothetical protein